jgi:hypothetical protein
MDDLPAVVATHERKIDDRDIQEGYEAEVYATLIHTHIPMMTEIDVIDMPSEPEIAPGAYFEDVVSLLGSHGPTTEVVCEACGERQLLVEPGVECEKCEADTLSPLERG